MRKFFAAVIVMTVFLPVFTYAYSGNGDGSSGNPYQISSVADWQTLMATPADWDDHFILTTNISLAGITVTPVGNATPFTGVFDGSGYAIREVDIDLPEVSGVGLFGYVGTGGQIKRLGVKKANINGLSGVGGLVGANSGTLTDCYAAGSVSGDYYIGGLVGLNRAGVLTKCYATGSAEGDFIVGGLAGSNEDTPLTSCYATGSVVATGTGNYGVGGLVGQNLFPTSVISFCYAAGSVSGTGSYVGGLVGENNNGIITSCFWDMETSGQTGCVGGRGLTTEQMKNLSIYQNLGWDNQGWTLDDGVDYPHLSWENSSGVPIPLPQQVPLAGGGTAGDPYRVSTAYEFALLSWYCEALNKHIKLTASLDLGSVVLHPIGGDFGPFTGVFDGDGFALSNAEIHFPRRDYVGLFGSVGAGGLVNDLTVADVDIQGYRNLGGLAGRNDGTITRCGATGNVTGAGYLNGEIGGLVGSNAGFITDCYATAEVNGYWIIGGLLGNNYNYGQVNSCCATGSVTGVDVVAGLVGYDYAAVEMNYTYIADCYATGAVTATAGYVGGLVAYAGGGIIMNCFWDTQTTGQAGTSGGGTGKTTVQMKTRSTFTGAGWDFLNIWTIEENISYPRLQWQGGDPDYGYSGGSGTQANPYQIATPYDWQVLIQTRQRWDEHFILTADINLAGVALTPLGNNGSRFTGTLDGNNHTISNVVMHFPANNNAGLFGYLGAGGQIKDLTVANIDIQGNDHVGGLAAQSEGSIDSCRVTGSVSGIYYIGGLVGSNVYPAPIDSSHAAVTASGYNYVGGLVGDNTGPLTACGAAGSISGSSAVGGLTGRHYNSSITSCYATGSVSGNNYVGGLTGSNGYQSPINFCYTTGTVNYVSNGGGLAGENAGAISCCYARGPVIASYAGGGGGGLVGYNYEVATISCSYAAGQIVGVFAGGLVGSDFGTITACFWDALTSGTSDGVGNVDPDPAGAVGKTTNGMKSLGTFIDAGWDFVYVWAICETTNTPRLQWQIPAADWVCPDGVAVEDLQYFVTRWLMENCAASNNCDGTDMNVSDKVDLADFALFAELWLEGM